MHCNLRPPKPRQPIVALITTLCQVWCRRTYSLPYYSVFAAEHYFTMWSWPDPVTLTSDIWPWTFAAYRQVTRWNSVPNLNAIEQSMADLLRLQCLTLWPWTHFKRCAWLWDNFHQVWPSTTYLCLNYSAFWCRFFMSRCCDLDLWPLDIELLKHFGCHALKLRTKFKQNRIIHGWVIDDLPRFRVQF